MDRMQRLIVEFILALFAFPLISIVPSVSKAEPLGSPSNELALIDSTNPKTSLPESVWPLGFALTGVAAIFRRKAH